MASSSASVSPTPSVTGAKRGTVRSPVWNFFNFNEATGNSACQVLLSNGDLCAHIIAGKYPTNLKQHLKKSHPDEYSRVLEIEASVKKAKEEAQSLKFSISHKAGAMASRQLTLSQSVATGKHYVKGSDRYQQITRKLAIFVGGSNVANSIVESVEFRDLLLTLDSRYKVPQRAAICEEIQKILIEIKAKAASFIQEASKISICGDIWSKKGLTASFLGITVHFFSKKDHKRHCATLAVRRMPSPHTADHVREMVLTVLSEWDIPISKVMVIVTDNGSNMVAAFKKYTATCTTTDEDNDSEEGDDETDSDVEDDFDEKELEHEATFFSMKRIGCFAHSFQLVVHKFDQFPGFRNLLKQARHLNAKVNSSTKATERLIELCGKKLIKDCRTRWSSTFLMLQRLTQLREPLAIVLRELEWDDLAASEWRSLSNVQSLLQPFADFTTLVSGEDYTTISTVIPTIMELNLHLEKMKSHPEVSDIARILQRELQRRFRKFTDPGDTEFNPLFAVATTLDPRYRVILNTLQLQAAKQHILKEVKDMIEDNSSSEGESPRPEINEYEAEPPSKKRFTLLDSVIQEKWKETLKKTTKQPPGQIELDHYLCSVENVKEEDDILKYWVDQQLQYPYLSRIAVDVLVIPASSAPVERVFSTAGESCIGRRNRLTDANLEREVMIKKE